MQCNARWITSAVARCTGLGTSLPLGLMPEVDHTARQWYISQLSGGLIYQNWDELPGVHVVRTLDAGRET